MFIHTVHKHIICTCIIKHSLQLINCQIVLVCFEMTQVDTSFSMTEHTGSLS